MSLWVSLELQSVLIPELATTVLALVTVLSDAD